MKKVVIVQTRMPRYRKPVFEALRDNLEEHSIRLEIIHGMTDPRKPGRPDDDALDWAMHVQAYCPFGKRSGLLWQPVFSHVKNADLVVVTQENRLLQNYRLLASRGRCGYRVGFWGHGQNFQSGGVVSERWRRWQTQLPDWWFAYTELSKEALVQKGFSDEKITVLNNATDTTTFRQQLKCVSDCEMAEARAGLGILPDAPVGVFCSSLHAGKRLEFLVEAVEAIRAKMPSFEFVVVGDGPCRDLIKAAADRHSWFHWVGAQFGREKAVWLKAADVFLMPFFVGLSILDAFCAGLPVVAVEMAHGQHSPEIGYLNGGRNGAFAGANPDDFGETVAELLADKEKLQSMAQAAFGDAGEYTAERMASRFQDGIMRALKAS